MLPPSYAITTGQPPAGGVPEGKVMVGENEIDLPATVAVIFKVVPEKLAVSESGGPGRTPAS